MCHLVNAYEVKKAGMVCLQCKNCVTHGALYKSMYIYLSWLLLFFFNYYRYFSAVAALLFAYVVHCVTGCQRRHK